MGPTWAPRQAVRPGVKIKPAGVRLSVKAELTPNTVPPVSGGSCRSLPGSNVLGASRVPREPKAVHQRQASRAAKWVKEIDGGKEAGIRTNERKTANFKVLK